MAYSMYPNATLYIQDLQGMKDRIDAQIRQLQQGQVQQQAPQPITQNFQLANTQSGTELEGRYAKNIEEVKNTFVIKPALFVSADYSQLWIKDVTGKIRAFNLEEIFEEDEKDREIAQLRQQIEEMKGMISYDANNNNVIEPATTKKPTRVSSSAKANSK